MQNSIYAGIPVRDFQLLINYILTVLFFETKDEKNIHIEDN